MAIGQQIKSEIEHQGLSQSFVAKKIGISVQTMNGICNDRQGIPLDAYFKICDVLGVPLEYFREQSKAKVG